MKSKKKQYLVFFIMIAGILSCNHNKKQDEFTAKSNSKIKKELDSLAGLQTEEAQKRLEQRLKQLSESNDESKVLLTFDYFYTLGKGEKADSLSVVMKEKFPNGISARFAAYQDIFSGEGPDKKYELYKSWKQKYPPENYDLENQDIYNSGLYFIIEEYAEAGDFSRIEELVNQLIDHPKIAITYFNIANLFYQSDQYDKALGYLQKTMDSSKKWIENKNISTSLKQTVHNIQNDTYLFYANILAKKENCEEAITYYQNYKDAVDYLDIQANLNYADCLETIGDNKKAFQQLDEIIKMHGEAYEENYDRFKRLFLETQGNQKDFKDYEKQLASQFQKQLEEELEKEMISEKAPNVTLVDFDGNEQQLADLKGKMLILDFWATWCHPCKASFPAMQNIKKRYENDENVKFLFINTMQNQSEAIVKKDVNDFLSKHNYQFDVYKDSKTKANSYPIADAFKVQAIPFKFIIDEKGFIRYKIKGYEGNLDSEETKLMAMIKMVKQK